MSTTPKLKGYRFLERLGEGFFGEVWKAEHETLGQLRAIKVLRPNEYTRSAVDRLLNEARRMVEVEGHDHLARVYDAIDGTTNCFVIMQYVNGGDLSSRLRHGRPLPWREAIKYVHQAALGLGRLHKLGLLHCDIKPDNILIDNASDRAILGDLGLASPADTVQEFGAHEAYAAPEVLSTKTYSFAADVYSLAATLLQVTTGRPVTSGIAPNAGELPTEVLEAIKSGLEPDPSRRSSLSKFAAMLWNAYWVPVCRRLDERCGTYRPSVKLRLAVSVGNSELQEPLAQVSLDDLKNGVRRTGDLIKIDCTANTNGHLTVLVADSSGAFEIGYPNDDVPAGSEVAGGEVHSLTFTLTPPAGSVSFFVIWHKQVVRVGPNEWRTWLEAVAEKSRVRGARIIDHRVGRLPEKSFDYQQVVVAHDERLESRFPVDADSGK